MNNLEGIALNLSNVNEVALPSNESDSNSLDNISQISTPSFHLNPIDAISELPSTSNETEDLMNVNISVNLCNNLINSKVHDEEIICISNQSSDSSQSTILPTIENKFDVDEKTVNNITDINLSPKKDSLIIYNYRLNEKSDSYSLSSDITGSNISAKIPSELDDSIIISKIQLPNKNTSQTVDASGLDSVLEISDTQNFQLNNKKNLPDSKLFINLINTKDLNNESDQSPNTSTLSANVAMEQTCNIFKKDHLETNEEHILKINFKKDQLINADDLAIDVHNEENSLFNDDVSLIFPEVTQLVHHADGQTYEESKPISTDIEAAEAELPDDSNFQMDEKSHPSVNFIPEFNQETKNDVKTDKISNECIDEEELSCVYHIKWIMFNGHKLPIITQNENGPCPLLAICNLLLLRGNITIPAETMLIESTRLLSYLTDYIFDCTPRNISADNRLNYEQNMNDAIAIFPKLQTGLDVNVRFTGVSHFEFTTECIVFDLLNIPLYHGWLVDPTDNVAGVIGTLTYNQLVEKIICQKNSEDLCGDALLAEDFLDRTASQMTYHGLCELNSTLSNDDMAVLFRNNHFLTLYKHKDEMYVLATDHGFLVEPQVVWESLGNIEGDSIFLDGNLKPFRSSDPVVSDPNQIDRDFQLALSLKEEGAGNLDLEDMPWDANILLTDHELALQIQAEENNLLTDTVPRFNDSETSTSTVQNPVPLSLRSGTQLHSSSSTSDVQPNIPTSQSRRSVAAGSTKEKKESNCALM